MDDRSLPLSFDPPRLWRGALELGADLLGRLPGSGGSSLRFDGLRPPLPRGCAGDAARARDLYHGVFSFAGHRLECRPTEVFRAAAPDAAWASELLAFTWLADLETSGLALYRPFARAMVAAWSKTASHGSPDVAWQRLAAFARHGHFLASGAPEDFTRLFFAIITREARRLLANMPREAASALPRAAALVWAGLAFRGGEALLPGLLERLAEAASGLVLPDGGPVNRNPRFLLDLLAQLVPLREAMACQRIAVPRDLNAVIERALPALRMLSHGDGGLALFQGAEGPAYAEVRAILDRDEAAGRPLAHAVHAGYCRLAQGQSAVIVDCGAPVLCESALAFEFSHGAQRIVGNCGFPSDASPGWREAAKLAAAHSTLDIDDGASRRVQSFFRRGRRLPARAEMPAELIASPHGTLLTARSSAHEAALGLLHCRELFLAADGNDLRGEDRFVPAGTAEPDGPDTGFAIRFHLHPAVRASLDRKGNAVMLQLANREAWAFTIRGGGLALEESVFLAGESPRASQQIVIRGIAGRPERVNWAFKKLDRPSRPAPGDSAAAPRLPF